MERALIFFIVLGVYRALAEKSESATTTTTELSKRYFAGDQLPVNIVRAKNSSQLVSNKSKDEESQKTDKKPRTVNRDSGFESRDNSSCCGSRYSSSGSARPDYNYNRILLDTGRYPQYGERNPIDRYGWQTQARPAGSVESGGRPSEGGNYGGNRVYAGSQSGDRYGPRPGYGNEVNRPPNNVGHTGNTGYGYGSGYGRPTGGYGSSFGGSGGYGVSGTFADGDEFGPGEAAYPNAGVSHHGNLHAQKAVALKALAGVALIGAAAALASNPVLLPIGIVAGRKKRSESFPEEAQTEIQMDYILNVLRENLDKIRKHGSSGRLFVSPRCVARLTCEIQKEYLLDVGKDVEILNAYEKQYLTKLIRNNVLGSASVSANVRNSIKLAVDVATENKSCDVFPCNYIRKG